MSKIIDNTLVMSQEETYNEITKFLSENYAPCVDKDFIKGENKKMLEEQIDNIINEELGIADEVVRLANLIERQVYSLIGQGVNEKTFNVKTELSDVNVDYTFKEFNTEEELVSWFKETRRYDGYSYQENTIYLSICMLDGKLDKIDLNDTIMHECNHYWECKKSGKTAYNDVYDIITNGISNWNPCISTLCEILYYCDEHEINSFVNGTYSTAMKKKKHYNSYKQFIADNSVNKPYLLLRNAEKTIKEFEQESNTYYFLAEFWFINNGIFDCETNEVGDKIILVARYAYNYLIKRIGKAFALYTAKLKEYEEKAQEAKIKMMLQRRFGEKENGDV